MDTATEVRVMFSEYVRAIAPVSLRLQRYQREMIALHRLHSRRRKSKGFRKHVRRMKAKQR